MVAEKVSATSSGPLNTKKSPKGLLARLGAISYLLWALLHFQAAWGTYKLGSHMPPGMAAGRVLQDSWNLAWFSIIAIASAVGLNWRNDVRGWWVNLVIVSVADVGFILFVLVPGYLPLWPGLAGPVFWLLGLALTTAAQPWDTGVKVSRKR